MASEDRRREFWKLFTRPKRSRRESKVKPVSVPGVEGRISDALGASRAMRPTVLMPAAPTGPATPQLTVLRPPAAGASAPREVPAPVAAGRRMRFSLSLTAFGTLVSAFCLLLLVAFILGTRYEYNRLHAVAAGPQGEGGGSPVVRGTDPPPGPGGRVPPVEIGPRGGAPPGPAAADATRYRLRICLYPMSERQKADQGVATLRQAGVAASILVRRISGRDQLVIYADPIFASRSSAEADALQQKVRLVKQDGRYEFATAYYVTAD